MRCTKNGQSLIEYAMLATIVMLGMIVGGPTLIRAVQGYFKITADSVQDAESEVITQAAPQPKLTCQCFSAPANGAIVPTALEMAAWPASGCGVSGCTTTEQYHFRSCFPMNCAREDACIPDNTCCTPLVPVACGMRLNPSECPTRELLDPHLPAYLSGTCAGTSDCAIGERIYSVTCGSTITSTVTYFGCGNDNDTQNNCLPTCWPPPIAGSTDCNPGAENSNPLVLSERQSLINELGWRKILPPPGRDYLPNGSINPLNRNAYNLHYVYLPPIACNTNAYCERICPAGQTPNATNSGCI